LSGLRSGLRLRLLHRCLLCRRRSAAQRQCTCRRESCGQQACP